MEKNNFLILTDKGAVLFQIRGTEMQVTTTNEPVVLIYDGPALAGGFSAKQIGGVVVDQRNK